jgi:hypothetical protein
MGLVVGNALILGIRLLQRGGAVKVSTLVLPMVGVSTDGAGRDRRVLRPGAPRAAGSAHRCDPGNRARELILRLRVIGRIPSRKRCQMSVDPSLGIRKARERFTNRSALDRDLLSEAIGRQRRLVAHDGHHRYETMCALSVCDIITEHEPLDRAERPVDLERIHHDGLATGVVRRVEAAVECEKKVVDLDGAAAQNMDVLRPDFDLFSEHGFRLRAGGFHRGEQFDPAKIPQRYNSRNGANGKIETPKPRHSEEQAGLRLRSEE